MKPLENRAFELDALRGMALVLMILHHLIFDLRYEFGLNVFGFQESWWFVEILRPSVLSVFLVISGISCTFSRSNTRRGLRLLGVALLFTVATTVVSNVAGGDYYILFNVLHLLALGTLIYSGLTFSERKQGIRKKYVDVILLLLAAVLIWLVPYLSMWQGKTGYWLLPLGLLPNMSVGMLDYLPLIPWLAVFFIGALIGRIAYANKKTAFPGAPNWLLAGSRPLEFVGRNTLIIYVIHQPLLLAILYGLRYVGLF